MAAQYMDIIKPHTSVSPFDLSVQDNIPRAIIALLIVGLAIIAVIGAILLIRSRHHTGHGNQQPPAAPPVQPGAV